MEWHIHINLSIRSRFDSQHQRLIILPSCGETVWGLHLGIMQKVWHAWYSNQTKTLLQVFILISSHGIYIKDFHAELISVRMETTVLVITFVNIKTSFSSRNRDLSNCIVVIHLSSRLAIIKISWVAPWEWRTSRFLLTPDHPTSRLLIFFHPAPRQQRKLRLIPCPPTLNYRPSFKKFLILYSSLKDVIT